MHANRNFKNNVFTMLFSEPDLLRELYCALEGVSLPPDSPVSINTLKNVLFMDVNNDISFEIDGKLVVLIEHQSSINPNMALRLFQYIAEVYKGMIDRKTIYSKKQVTIPWPEFFILYNGKDPLDDKITYRLSDLFEKPHELGIPEKAKPLLELEVQVININEGRNKEIVSRCKKLSEYSTFIAKIRSFLIETQDLPEAISLAIKDCSEYGILREFLEIHGREVLNMLCAEWNWDDALAVAREEGHEDGWNEACKHEKTEIARNLLSEGSTPEFVQKTTGLSLEEIAKL